MGVRRLRLLALSTFTLGSAYACSEYDSSLLVPAESGGTGGANDAGSDVSSGGTADKDPFWPHQSANGCDTEGVPTADQRPSVEDAADLPPLYLGMFTVHFGSAKDDKPSTPDPDAWQSIGFDLDGRCNSSTTCTGESDELGCKNSQVSPDDGEACRDNAFGSLFTVASQVPALEPFGLTEAHLNCGLLHGEFGVMFKISGYNGSLNDPNVRLDVYSSDGAERLSQSICGTSGGGLPTDWSKNAAWLESDQFRMSSRYLTKTTGVEPKTLPDSIYADANAYVRNGYLIAQLPDPTEFWFSGARSGGHTAGARLLVHRGVIAAKLVLGFQDENWSIPEGTLGGVIKPSEFIGSLREIGMCENLCGSDQALLDFLNQRADSLLEGDPNPDVECDGLSLGIQFTAKEATPGEIVDVPEPTECGSAPSDAPPIGCSCPCSATGGTGGSAGSGGTTGGSGGTTGGSGGTTGGSGGTTGGSGGATGGSGGATGGSGGATGGSAGTTGAGGTN